MTIDDKYITIIVVNTNILQFGLGGMVFMKSSGIVRRMDPLGRLVVPKEIRKVLNINPQDPFEIYVDNNTIVLRKYEPACFFCNETENVINYHGYNICKNCIEKLKESI